MPENNLTGEADMTIKEKSCFQKHLEDGKAHPEEIFRILGEIQDSMGHISTDAIEALAVSSGIPKARLYGLATAYPSFKVIK